MLDIRRLRMLHEFAALGSIARTADALGYTPSAVSQQLAALEREAGIALVDRTARSAGLTDAGRRLARRVERIPAMAEEAGAGPSAGSGRADSSVAFGFRGHRRGGQLSRPGSRQRDDAAPGSRGLRAPPRRLGAHRRP